MTTEAQTRLNMDRMYRWTRHIYDASRKYYLLGRDVLIAQLKPVDGEHVIEVGCGTARNLRKLGPVYPKAHFYGLDASDEMLKTARKKVPGVRLEQGFSQSFDPKVMFDLKDAPDKLVYSYSLSIIPPWRESIDHGLKLLKDGGEMHIIDFGGQEDNPAWFRAFLFWWLSLFHVYHKPEILNYLKRLQEEKKGTLAVEHLYNGYAYYAVFKKS